MIHKLSGGTDAGSMAFFDPTSLPLDFDSLIRKDIMGTISAAEARGELLDLRCDSDGAYLLYLYVDEELPEYLASYIDQEPRQSNLIVTSGQLCFSGIEYLHRDKQSQRTKMPGMGQFAQVPPGRYTATLHTTSYPDNMMEEELRAKISKRGYMLYRLEHSVGCLTILAFFTLTLSLIFTWNSVWNLYALAFAVATISALALLHRHPAYKKVVNKWEEVCFQYPSVVLLLELVG